MAILRIPGSPLAGSPRRAATRAALVALIVALFSMTNAASAAADRPATSERSLPVRVELAADGSVLSATALRDDVPHDLRALVEGSASRARYAPATVDGRPV